jgi:hypothetical protein
MLRHELGREMKCFEAFSLALWLSVCSSMPTKTQSEPSLASRILEALRDRDPGWKRIALIENRPLLVASERAIIFAVWVNPKSHSEDVNVYVYSVESREEAVAWLRPVRDKQVAPGWQSSTYAIGDEGYLSKFKDGERFEIAFRREKVVAWVKGVDLRRMKDSAKCVADQIPPT